LNFDSPGIPRSRGLAPVATMTAGASTVSSSSSSSVFTGPVKSWAVISMARRMVAPKRSAWVAKALVRSVPLMSSGKPG
jgi:hypothetical protein